MYIPLQIRLTSFYIVLLTLALVFFGALAYTQAEQRAYSNLDATLKSRAASVQSGKLMGDQSTLPSLLPGIAGVDTEGVAIEVFDEQSNLLATTDNTQNDITHPFIGNTVHSPVPWDAQALSRMQRHPSTASGIYSTVTYQGQRVRVYTVANNNFGLMHIIQTARSEQAVEQMLNNMLFVLLSGGALVILCASIGGWLITLGLLTRVQRITRTAYSINEKQNFSQRVTHRTQGSRDELSQLTETFNTMLDQLERLYRSQQRFVADASHELRAPITSICCNLDLLTKAPDLPPVEAQDALLDARAEAERLGRLVNDLLILARSDASQRATSSSVHKRIQPINLDSLVLDVFRQYRPAQDMEKQQEQPRLLLQHITPAQVAGDSDQLKQALVALVNNALKYTPATGTVSLQLTTNASQAMIEVKDTGMGIAAVDLPHIFERFYRAEEARTHALAGSGLGLSIAQSIVQEHRGSIEVSSHPDTGSTFTLRIPLLSDTSHDLERAAHSSNRS
ncbi:two-component sensor histidine kinase [Reticulibacter mediterranei]|uniref:histidine kinase n=1 Tax=Reticulibacter mediterranei TaxID=2778369 RepID=A0A8J3N8H9_9CHLR|nr:ATP-binding protein [Reticulibacter mediterranei]GHO99713.1 two-component sensor histidine kinase [Reticulibacter mediterranei]